MMVNESGIPTEVALKEQGNNQDIPVPQAEQRVTDKNLENGPFQQSVDTQLDVDTAKPPQEQKTAIPPFALTREGYGQQLGQQAKAQEVSGGATEVGIAQQTVGGAVEQPTTAEAISRVIQYDVVYPDGSRDRVPRTLVDPKELTPESMAKNFEEHKTEFAHHALIELVVQNKIKDTNQTPLTLIRLVAQHNLINPNQPIPLPTLADIGTRFDNFEETSTEVKQYYQDILDKLKRTYDDVAYELQLELKQPQVEATTKKVEDLAGVQKAEQVVDENGEIILEVTDERGKLYKVGLGLAALFLHLTNPRSLEEITHHWNYFKRFSEQDRGEKILEKLKQQRLDKPTIKQEYFFDYLEELDKEKLTQLFDHYYEQDRYSLRDFFERKLYGKEELSEKSNQRFYEFFFDNSYKYNLERKGVNRQNLVKWGRPLEH